MWSLARLAETARIRQPLIKLVKILAWLLFVLCAASLILAKCIGSPDNLAFLVSVFIGSAILLFLLPQHQRFERKLFRLIWKYSSRKVVHGLLLSPTEDVRQLTIDSEKITLATSTIACRAVKVVIETDLFVLLVASIKRSWITTPLFLFLRNSNEIKIKLKEVVAVESTPVTTSGLLLE